MNRMQAVLGKEPVPRQQFSLTRENSPTQNRVERVLFYVFLAVVLTVPLAFLRLGRPSMVKWFIIGTFPPVIAVFWVFNRTFAGRLRIQCSIVTLGVLALLVTHVISLVAATNAYLTLTEISKMLGLVATYFLVANLCANDRDLDKLVWAVALSGCVAAIYGILQHFGYDFMDWEQVAATPVERGPSTFGHANFAAHFFIIAIPLTVVLAIRQKSYLLRGIAVLPVLAMVGHLLISGARGAALGIALAAAIVTAVLLRRQGRTTGADEEVSRVQIPKMAMAAVCVLLVATACVIVVKAWRVKESDALAFEEGQGIFRVRLWGTGARVFMDKPVLGCGAGNYEVASMPYWDDWEQENFVNNNKMSYHVHNEYIETLAEQGIIGFGAFLFLIVAALHESFQISKSRDSRGGPLYGFAFLAAIVAVAVDSIFNFDLHTPAAAFSFWMMLGMITFLASGRKSRSNSEPCDG